MAESSGVEEKERLSTIKVHYVSLLFIAHTCPHLLLSAGHDASEAGPNMFAKVPREDAAVMAAAIASAGGTPAFQGKICARCGSLDGVGGARLLKCSR